MHAGLKHCILIAGVGPLLFACADTSPPRTQDDGVRLYRGLDDGDLVRMTPILQQTLETALSGETGSWRNDATNRSGSVRPLRTFRTASGYFCRDFQESIAADGGDESHVRTACRSQAGLWVIALGVDRPP
jgi:surface antigen